jgi:amino acid permease
MKVKLKEDPKEWRKTTLLTALGVVLLCSFLRWRGILSNGSWHTILAAMGVVALTACLFPRLFRGFYRGSTWVGFYLSQALARVVLALMFFLLLTPLSLVFRLAGKDPLQIRRRQSVMTYWHPAKETSPLDRLF